MGDLKEYDFDELLKSEMKKKEFAKNARKIAEKKFSMDLQVEKYVALAKELNLQKIT